MTSAGRSAGDGRERLLGFLRTDGRDAGCGRARELLDVYVELVSAGVDPERRYPGITAHLHDCRPCREDFEDLLGLLDSARATST